MNKDNIKLITVSEDSILNWKEDFEHENGKYTCKCVFCLNHFVGHKRRVCCKVCAELKNAKPISKQG